MKSLIQLLWKNNFLILFILLELVAVSLIVRNNNFHRASFASTSNAISGKIYQKKNEITEFLNLKNSNQILAEENVLLKQKLNTFLVQQKDSFTSFYDSIRIQSYSYLTAQVINNSTNKHNNYFTLNKGEDDGIKREMAVVSSQGTVGIIKNVSKNFASGISLLHSKTKISAKIKSNGYFGPLSWDTNNPTEMILGDIPSHVKLNIGDSVITSGYSSIFPAGLPIGKIIAFENDEAGNFHRITVKLFNDFRKLDHVYIISNLKKKEQLELEEMSQTEKDE